ncbi:dynein axonemal heavy chain 12-like [Schistocerca serialis cubense]|uniref:dynein axonemal heavy chain 12-like n=2 Tax=Schistocerca TaxID=7008 RepID=UPI00214E1DC2|nr:dynein axonemal heavy chain 12-like [Schistocerca serialis cubense]
MADNEKLFADMFDWLVPPCMKFLHNEATHILMHLGETQLVKTMSEIIEMLMDDALVLNGNNNNYVRFWLQAAFVFGGSWTFASVLDDEGRVMFDEFYKGIWKGLESDHPVPRSLEIVDISIPKEGLLIDLVYTFKGKGAWNYWSEVVRTAEIKERISLQQTLIPTMDSVR